MWSTLLKKKRMSSPPALNYHFNKDYNLRTSKRFESGACKRKTKKPQEYDAKKLTPITAYMHVPTSTTQLEAMQHVVYNNLRMSKRFESGAFKRKTKKLQEYDAKKLTPITAYMHVPTSATQLEAMQHVVCEDTAVALTQSENMELIQEQLS
ncbi:hypothetical protein CEXT_216981 [Caerostris extrusa]|uniref:Uncharacterized protein n=1 Tax=Caerostris extrusa TaxID=172846 RepID=A0AAV4XJ26_CAEEX|nr:hypothetical protein CEXT_216981 [Caerostris extrusa]